MSKIVNMAAYDFDSAKVEAAVTELERLGYRIVAVSGNMIFMSYLKPAVVTKEPATVTKEG